MTSFTHLIESRFNKYERSLNYAALQNAPSSHAKGGGGDALLGKKIAVWQNPSFKSAFIDNIRQELKELSAQKTKRWYAIIGRGLGDEGHTSTIHKAWVTYKLESDKLATLTDPQACAAKQTIVAEARTAYELLDRERLVLESEIEPLNTLLSLSAAHPGSVEAKVDTLIQGKLSIWREKQQNGSQTYTTYAMLAAGSLFTGIAAASCYLAFRRMRSVAS